MTKREMRKKPVHSFVVCRGLKQSRLKNFERLLDTLLDEYGNALQKGEDLVIVADVTTALNKRGEKK